MTIDPARVRWIASFPKSGNTWVRIFLANLIVGKPDRALTLAEITAMPFYSDNMENPEVSCELLGKAHHPYSLERHGTKPAIYIVRDPVDVAVSAARYFGVTPQRMAKEVARDWSRHVQSWWGHVGLVLKYENMPSNFHALAQYLTIPSDFGSVSAATYHSGLANLQRDEQENGFEEANADVKDPFFRRGSPGEGREVLTPDEVQMIIDGAGEWYEHFGYGEIDART
tara:strand:+ start:203 stop:883 length:681 start_codon:yes stop_codon:yes gene_type:complete